MTDVFALLARASFSLNVSGLKYSGNRMLTDTLPARERLCKQSFGGILYRVANGRPTLRGLSLPGRTKTLSAVAGIVPVPATVSEIRRINLRHIRDGLP